MSPTKKKIFLLLMAGIALGFSYSPNRQRKVLHGLTKEWKNIDRKQLNRDIHSIYQSKLVRIQENKKDGSCTYILTEKGKYKALTYRIEEMQIPKQKWDYKWRIVAFDIPEKLRKGRDAFREKLQSLGFYELQKSVLVYPYECSNEIEFLIEFWAIRKYVRYGVLESIDNELHLKTHFQL
jgi:hypothetical protein